VQITSTTTIDRELEAKIIKADIKFRDRLSRFVTPFAQVLTGRRNVQVLPHPSMSFTDNKTIHLRIPLELGEDTEHEKEYCDKRDSETLEMLCPACWVLDDIDAVTFHEVGHMAHDSFSPITDGTKAEAYEKLLREKIVAPTPELLAKASAKLHRAVNGSQTAMELAGMVDCWLPRVVNIVEDIFVDARTVAARPGTEAPMYAHKRRALTKGWIDTKTGKQIVWAEQEVNARATMVVYALGMKLDFIVPSLGEEVQELGADPDLASLLAEIPGCSTAEDRFLLGMRVLELLRKHNFCIDSGSILVLPPPPPGRPCGSKSEDEETEEEQESEGDESEGEGEGDGGEASEDDTEEDDDDTKGGAAAPDEDADSTDESKDEPSGHAGGLTAEQDSEEDDEDGEGEGGDKDADDEDEAGSTGNGASSQDSDDGDDDEADDDSDEATGNGGDEADDDDAEGEDDEDGTGDGDGSDDDDLDGDDEADSSDDDPQGVGADGKNRPDMDDDPESQDLEGIDDAYESKEDEQIAAAGAEALLSKFMDHDPDKDAEPATPQEEEARELAKLVFEQKDFFDNVSPIVRKVTVRRPTKAELQYVTLNGAPTTSDVMPSLNSARLAFSNNRKLGIERNLKRGKKLDGAHLSRLVTGDPRIFANRSVPKKRDWFVSIACDVSGSTENGIDKTIAKGAHAMADLLKALGIKFAIHGHSGQIPKGYSGYNDDPKEMVLIEVKRPEDQWDADAKLRCMGLTGFGANLDGHTLEWHRRLCLQQRAESKLIMYFTDGDMPAWNFDEEKDVLMENLRKCQRQGVTVVGVGVGTTSPKQYGLDCIRYDHLGDLPALIKGLADHLS